MAGISFIVCLIVFQNILKVIHVANKELQSIDTTLANAATIVEKMKGHFEKLRSEEGWNEMWK